MARAPLKLVQPIDTSSQSVEAFVRQPVKRELGDVLRAMGVVTGDQLEPARNHAKKLGIELGRFLRLNKMVSASSLLKARSRATGYQIADLDNTEIDPRLIDRLGASHCIRKSIVPMHSVGGAILVAAADPDDAEKLNFGPERIIPLLAEENDIEAAVTKLRSRQLSRRAEVRTDEDFSCRDWPVREVRNISAFLAMVGLIWALVSPLTFVSSVLAWTIATMVALLALKLTAAGLHVFLGPVREDDPDGVSTPLIRRTEVSIMVPLFREKEIALQLVKRLQRLTYPKELLEICLVVEANDAETKATLKRTEFPPWFKVVEVPKGRIQTKPRALNYALDFCRGQVIGIYDAEDAPEPDQIDRIVARFQRRGPNVACLQGRLDYYNPRANWLSRCFTIEYATWFRIILPGLQRLGWPVPLGGTTLFFRRSALEELGAWDAHNVTEDADLGLRLARMGYKTELVDTVTYEEANCRLWPWIKQRSRWLKGYAVTYAVHMRAPRRLLRDLGLWKFIGMQVLFLGTLSQFVLAPLLWTFLPALFGYWHPFQGVIGYESLLIVTMIFLASEVISIGVGLLAVSTKEKRHLMGWVPTLMGYFPFATIAALKGLSELRGRPFYWDKTSHGVVSPKTGKA